MNIGFTCFLRQSRCPSYGRTEMAGDSFGVDTAASCEWSVYRRRSASHIHFLLRSVSVGQCFVYNNSVMKLSRVLHFIIPECGLIVGVFWRYSSTITIDRFVVVALSLDEKIHFHQFTKSSKIANLQPDFKTFWQITKKKKKKMPWQQ